MEETKLQLKIRTRYWTNFWSGVHWFFYKLLTFFGLVPELKYWGVVYDSVSKEPLDPAVVELVYMKGGQAQTAITDLKGRYGFLAEPGKFKILARKANYSFPSQLVNGAEDGIYNNLYHGETFELRGDYEVVAPNIPLDPMQADWNQQAKAKIVPVYPYWRKLGRVLVQIAFWVGFIFVILDVVTKTSHLARPILAVLIGYLALFFLTVVISGPRLWGQLRGNIQDKAVTALSLKLKKSKFPDMEFGQTTVRENGKFFLKALPGRYLMQVEAKNKDGQVLYRGQKKVVVPGRGILDKFFSVKLKR